MVGPFNAGVVRVDFESDVKGLQRGLTQIDRGLNKVGTTVQKTAATVQKSAGQMNRAFSAAGKGAATIASRASQGVQRLLSLQLVISQFGSRAGLGKFGKEISAATDGLITFAAIVTVIPTQLGIAIGAVSGLSIALVQLLGVSQEQIKVEQARSTFVNQTIQFFEKLENQVQDVSKVLRAFGATEAQVARGVVSTVQAQVKALDQFIDQTIGKRKATSLLITDASGSTLKTLESLRNQQEIVIDRATRQRERLLKEAATRSAEASLAEFNAFAGSLQEGFNEIQKQSADALNLGITDPLTRAGIEAQNAEQAVIALQKRIRELGKIAGDPRVDEKLRERFQREIDARGGTRVGALQDAARQARAREAAIRRPMELSEQFQTEFSEPFGQALGQATFEGILQGAEAMEIVANIGENLFANFLNQSITNFQDGMIKAFDAIAGQGGAVLGQALSAAVGIAGFFLSKQGRGDSSAAFAGVESAIDSSQAVRGVVAGPTSVAIAAVGEDLRRAMEPVRELMAMSLVELRKIRSNTSSGPGGGGGGQSLAGSVATT